MLPCIWAIEAYSCASIQSSRPARTRAKWSMPCWSSAEVIIATRAPARRRRCDRVDRDHVAELVGDVRDRLVAIEREPRPLGHCLAGWARDPHAARTSVTATGRARQRLEQMTAPYPPKSEQRVTSTT